MGGSRIVITILFCLLEEAKTMKNNYSYDDLFNADYNLTMYGRKQRINETIDKFSRDLSPMILSPNQTLDMLGTKEEFENPFNDEEHNELLEEKLRTEYQEEMMSEDIN